MKAEGDTWIPLYRKILSWEWYHDSHMVHLMVHLIAKANHEETRYKGQLIKRGQHMTGFRKLAAETGMSVQKIRTCIKRLKSTQEITHQSTHHGSIITLCNYPEYNPPKGKSNTPINTQINIQSTHHQHNNNNYKKEKKSIPSTTLQEYKADFDSWWTRFRSTSSQPAGKRKLAERQYAANRNKYSVEQIDLATRHYFMEKRESGQKEAYASTFLNPKEDLIGQYQEAPHKPTKEGQFNPEDQGWKPAEEHYGKDTDLMKDYNDSLKIDGAPYAN